MRTVQSRISCGVWTAGEVLLQQRELEKEPTRTCELKPLAAVVSLSASQCLEGREKAREGGILCSAHCPLLQASSLNHDRQTPPFLQCAVPTAANGPTALPQT